MADRAISTAKPAKAASKPAVIARPPIAGPAIFADTVSDGAQSIAGHLKTGRRDGDAQ